MIFFYIHIHKLKYRKHVPFFFFRLKEYGNFKKFSKAILFFNIVFKCALHTFQLLDIR